jgi:hypothetical protein
MLSIQKGAVLVVAVSCYLRRRAVENLEDRLGQITGPSANQNTATFDQSKQGWETINIT